MDNPEVCPHGHPIPTADLSIADLDGTPLAEHGAGERVEVLRVAEDDEKLLGYLASLGHVPRRARCASSRSRRSTGRSCCP